VNDQVETAGRLAMRTGRVFGGLFCLAFVLAGIVAAWFIGREAWADLRVHFWRPTNCTILHSQAADRAAGSTSPYAVSIRYEYHWHDLTNTSEQIFRQLRTFSDYRDAQRLLERYRVGHPAKCRVNPARPKEALLELTTPWVALFLVIPLGFVVVGVAGFYAAIFGQTRDDAGVTSGAPISSRAGASANIRGAGCLMLFFFVFFAIGSAVFFATFIRPVLQTRAARVWTEVPCEIVSSRVQRHSGKSVTYSADVLFQYQVNGHPYRSNRHSFLAMSSSGHSTGQDIVDRYPAGARTVCFVNPADPTEAVLDRTWPRQGWLGLFPLIFVVVGLGGMTYGWRLRGRSPAGSTSRGISKGGGAVPLTEMRQASRPAIEPDFFDGEPVTLRSSKGRIGKFLFVFFFAAFWNGIVSVFVVQLFRGGQRGNIDWFLGLFLIPFVLIGLVLIGFLGYCLLGLFAPRAVLQLSRQPLRLGETSELSWRFSGRAHVIEQLRIYLEGREEATYRRGTSSSTDRNIFAEIDIATLTNVDEMRSGQGRIVVPAGTVPTFTATNNRIVWTLRVKGVIHLYPDVDDEFTVVVLPGAPATMKKEGA
jgi:hypothetical protein